MYSGVVKHVVDKITGAKLETTPYNWIEVNGVWPEEFYNQMILNRIPNDCLFSLHELGRVKTQYSNDRKILELSPKITILSQPIRQFWENVYRIICNDIEPVLLAKLQATHKPYGSEVLYTRDSNGFHLGPHTDRPDKILTALFYTPSTANNPELGTTIFVPHQQGFTDVGNTHFGYDNFTALKTVEYVPNKLFCFLKSDVSFHGVLPVDAEVDRDLLIFDVKKKLC